MIRKQFAAVVALGAACSVVAAPADPDPSFGSSGFAVKNFSITSGSAQIQGLVQQPDGKIVAAGHSYNGTSRDFALARFNTDGALDETFGVSGVVVTAMAGRDDFAQAVALQADGKLVVAGYVTEDFVAGTPPAQWAPRPRFAIARYQADGTLDPTFGIGGKVLTSLGEPDAFGPMDAFAYAVVIQADGKILVGGYALRPTSPYRQAIVVRYLSDGTLDTSFGASGKAVAPFDEANPGYALALQADGKILLAGDVAGDLAVSRFDSAGALDTGFGSGGKARITVGQNAEVRAVLVQPDGRIVLVGPQAVARLTASGQPDGSFGISGVVAGKGGYAAVLESDGRIVAAGNTPEGQPGQIADFRLYRFMPDGSADASFGTGGEVVTAAEPGQRNRAFALVRALDGKYAAGGFGTYQGLVDRFAIMRYSANGKTDAGWGSGGVANAFLGNSDDQIFGMAIQPDGGVLVVGQTFNAGNASYDLALARFLPSGLPDPSFGAGGRVVTALSPFNEAALAVAVQPDGKMVVAGYTYASGAGTADFLVARYLADGRLDTSFGGTGSVLIDFAGSDDRAVALALRPDGRIVVGGSAAVSGRLKFAAAQLLQNGDLDATFGANGITYVSIDSFAHDFPQGMALQADGAIILAGKRQRDDGTTSLVLVRLTANGMADASFGDAGIVIDPSPYSLNGANAAVVQPDGNIVIGGHQRQIKDDCMLRRYHPDGTVDTSFGSNGTVVVSASCSFVYALALQPNGKIVGVGAFNTSFLGFADLPVLRLNPDGSADASFGSNGLRLFSPGTMNDAGVGVALRQSGRIVIGGTTDAGASRDLLLMQLEGGPLSESRADLTGDGRSDILWRNTATGENYLYPMNGKTILAGEGYLRRVADLNWRIAGAGDFDGDGKSDILWRNAVTGQNYIYFMDGLAIKPTEGFMRTVADLNWQIVGIGDFDGDGKSDILWRNAVTGQNYVYFMDGLSIKPTEGYLRTVADTSWQIVGVGDFDGDGKSDVLWRNSASGQNYLYPMDGRAIKASEGFLRTVADPSWKVAGVGDFDGDGKADIVWRHNQSGQNYLYPMDGTTINPTEGYLRTVADLNWQIAAVGDYDGDGKSDLLWRNSSTGQNYLYPMDGTSIKPTEGYLRTVPPGNWTVVVK
jgi:uncharacterized delta-60 repeat protein